MTLTTHAVAGAALASLTPAHPIAGFCLGLASHYALDAIPHWDYAIGSDSIDPKRGGNISIDRALLRDIGTIGLDLLIGIALSFIFFASPATLITVAAGVAGGVMPDFLQFLYTRMPRGPMQYVQRFHTFVHSPRRLREEGRHFVGIGSQALIIAIFIVAARTFVLH